MAKKDFLPIILGSDENAYGTARLFCEAYDVRPLLLCTIALSPTRSSRLFDIEVIRDFEQERVFPDALLGVLFAGPVIGNPTPAYPEMAEDYRALPVRGDGELLALFIQSRAWETVLGVKADA